MSLWSSADRRGGMGLAGVGSHRSSLGRAAGGRVGKTPESLLPASSLRHTFSLVTPGKPSFSLCAQGSRHCCQEVGLPCIFRPILGGPF